MADEFELIPDMVTGEDGYPAQVVRLRGTPWQDACVALAGAVALSADPFTAAQTLSEAELPGNLPYLTKPDGSVDQVRLRDVLVYVTDVLRRRWGELQALALRWDAQALAPLLPDR
jgi:hypothetical protein